MTGEAKIKVISSASVLVRVSVKRIANMQLTLLPWLQVVGVGGGGSNAVNRMLANQLTGVEMYVMNTDAQVSSSPAKPSISCTYSVRGAAAS
jgi:cell division GTPase FtsZ